MTQVFCSHILVKHTGSRNPHSWRETTITRTKEQAIQKLKVLREQIVKGKKDFRQTAIIESDCSSSAQGGLLLGTIEQYQKPFADAYLKLKVGEISDIIETDSGVHIILRLPEGTTQ
ncbi:peptidyl-prolyl cis-trans isomerase, putative [Entamoeba histolytica HM-1:IMSS-B]|uniref:Peptidyl-prolyl cis-trans isomerase n=8 Tax=Entamoeba TaxID=5758 RepID=C4M181_ENTH1|nr:peptidyl-prolyl cis-trans isomerase, putative [Entamoeba nuttalli P19]XP_653673.2 peptidyl-prolyl cis-trans isomerase, putative [Entamoeba histolytica HM-1:IMSS]EMD49235.1 peptidylprolyl cis-trans isomerase, putative [Entamoeba histolytica KU27]EMH74482.1 peptidyl-prolyl cis-trans isomerase, putative [Entamoeba histolytica HM-1:IMSS-B]EMS15605.1 peptidyl-prolyl cis-trans isomerase [Entamoeba histolytica HM-3:IMSS]ENY63517.1 peptidyl-prolyl cis-trans isomerase, putative [Entamoeba histolytic|eukprot:XP_008860194.1 peptidyl-prolyl cis-trans isomerase, putative [Entamoeba nuttalli P19]